MHKLQLRLDQTDLFVVYAQINTKLLIIIEKKLLNNSTTVTTSIKMNQFKNKTTIKTNSCGNNAATETNKGEIDVEYFFRFILYKITKQHISCSKAKINSQHRASSAARKKRTKKRNTDE